MLAEALTITYDDFVSFMREAVLPRKSQHPEHIRLDGRDAGSSRNPFGYFRHNGGVWKVDEDTRYEPLLFAFNAAVAGEDPFIEEHTQGARGRRLALNEELTKRYASRHDYLYIYSN